MLFYINNLMTLCRRKIPQMLGPYRYRGQEMHRQAPESPETPVPAF